MNDVFKEALRPFSPKDSEVQRDGQHYPMADIIKCMRTSAYMLQIADGEQPRFNILNRKQAELLNAAADDLEAQTGASK